MGFKKLIFEKTYRKVFLEHDVSELLAYYNEKEKERFLDKLDAIHPHYYDILFEKMKKKLPQKDIKRLLNRSLNTESSFTFSYEEGENRDIYRAIQTKKKEKERTESKKKKSSVEETEDLGNRIFN